MIKNLKNQANQVNQVNQVNQGSDNDESGLLKNVLTCRKSHNYQLLTGLN